MKTYKLPDGRTLLTFDAYPDCAELYAAGRVHFSWPDECLRHEHIMLPSETTYEPEDVGPVTHKAKCGCGPSVPTGTGMCICLSIPTHRT